MRSFSYFIFAGFLFLNTAASAQSLIGKTIDYSFTYNTCGPTSGCSEPKTAANQKLYTSKTGQIFAYNTDGSTTGGIYQSGVQGQSGMTLTLKGSTFYMAINDIIIIFATRGGGCNIKIANTRNMNMHQNVLSHSCRVYAGPPTGG